MKNSERPSRAARRAAAFGACACLLASSADGLTQKEIDAFSRAELMETISGDMLDGPPDPGYTPEAGPLPREAFRLHIDQVWAGHRVGFDLATGENRQYAAYYNADRQLVVAARDLGSTKWNHVALPTRVGWDSHNYIALAIDATGRLHLSGNMHGDPLIYFRTREPGDIETFEGIHRMVGRDESRATYPEFFRGPDGELVFTYRQGSSGDGFNVYNRYDAENQEWERLSDEPLLDGEGEMNAYPIGPKRGPDGYYHLTWVWRDTPDAATNHDLSYARSRDLVNWETAGGRPIELPMTIDTEGLIIDPIPTHGGIINGSGKIGFDHQNRVIVTYHKFGEDGATQLYHARLEDGEWAFYQATDWEYRWEFGGGGSLPGPRVRHGAVHAGKDGLSVRIGHPKKANGRYRLDPETLELGERIPPDERKRALQRRWNRTRGDFSGLEAHTRRFEGRPGSGLNYVLRHEALPQNRDRPRPKPWPDPSDLELIAVETK